MKKIISLIDSDDKVYLTVLNKEFQEKPVYLKEFKAITLESNEILAHLDSAESLRLTKIINQSILSLISATKDPKIVLKIFKILAINLPLILSDLELSPSIKQLIWTQATNLDSILLKIFSLDTDPIFTSEDRSLGKINLYEKFSAASLKLKENLISQKDARALHWNIRQLDLLKWCRIMLENTANPFLSVAIKKIDPIGRREEATRVVEAIHAIQTISILFIACPDDTADNLADKDATDTLTDIPGKNRFGIGVARDKLANYRNGIFLEYFDAACDLWKTVVTRFQRWGGEDAWAIMSPLYNPVMDAIRFSQHLNDNPHDSDVTIDSIYSALPPNMMVETFRKMEEILLSGLEREYEIPKTSYDHEVWGKLVKLAQESASLSNSLATYYRELKENDLSNVLFFALNQWMTSHLETESLSIQQHFEHFCEAQGYRNHFFEHYSVPKDFLDLLNVRKLVNNEIFNGLDNLSVQVKSLTIPYSDFSDGVVLAKHVLAEVDKLQRDGMVPREITTMTLETLKKRIRHMELIDDYTKKMTKKSDVVSTYLKKWESIIQEMKALAEPLVEHKAEIMKFIHSWEEFLVMYLLFKHKPSGVI